MPFRYENPTRRGELLEKMTAEHPKESCGIQDTPARVSNIHIGFTAATSIRWLDYIGPDLARNYSFGRLLRPQG